MPTEKTQEEPDMEYSLGNTDPPCVPVSQERSLFPVLDKALPLILPLGADFLKSQILPSL